MSNFVLPIATIIFAGYFLFVSMQLPKAQEGIGPGGWPSAILIFMLILGVILLVQVYQQEKGKTKGTASEQKETKEMENEDATVVVYPYRHWIVFGIMVVYFFLMQYLGMSIVTPFFILAMGRTLGLRNLGRLALFSIITTVVTILLSNILIIPLPRGVGMFREFNSMLY